MKILNLFRRQNSKDDPYWEFDKKNHYKPNLNKNEFFALTGFDFNWFVLEPLSDYLEDEESELSKGKNLSYGQKALYYLWYVDGQVSNGGFIQYYYNGYGKYTPTLIKALKYVGDNKMADIINNSYEIFLKENIRFENAKIGESEDFASLYKGIKEFEYLDTEYYNSNEESLKKLEIYIRKNPNEFCLDEEGKEFDLSFSGELKTYYSNNKVKEIIPLLNGVINGTFKSFYENSNPKEEIYFNNGVPTGERIEYFENGNKKHTVRKDVPQNLFKHDYYFENGILKKQENKPDCKDEIIGEYKEWFDNGQLSKYGIYNSKHEKDGKWIEYYIDGRKKLESEYIDNDFLPHNFWNEKGEQILDSGTGLYIYDISYWEGHFQHNEEEYKNYKRHGKQYSYTNGILSLYQEMENGKGHGLTKIFDKNGKLKEEVIYVGGVEKSRVSF